MAADPPSKRSPLDQPSIVASAMALADEEGADAITMRSLAERLGYKVMSLYNHVENKDELFGLMADSVAAEIPEPAANAAAIDTVREIALQFRAALVAHPWASELWNRHLPGPARTAHMELLLRTMAATGLHEDLAHHGYHAVFNHVLGYTLQEQAMTLDTEYADDPERVAREYIAGLSPEEFPQTIKHVYQHLDGESESSFGLVLDLILDGLVALNTPS